MVFSLSKNDYPKMLINIIFFFGEEYAVMRVPSKQVPLYELLEFCPHLLF